MKRPKSKAGVEERMWHCVSGQEGSSDPTFTQAVVLSPSGSVSSPGEQVFSRKGQNLPLLNEKSIHEDEACQ